MFLLIEPANLHQFVLSECFSLFRFSFYQLCGRKTLVPCCVCTEFEISFIIHCDYFAFLNTVTFKSSIVQYELPSTTHIRCC